MSRACEIRHRLGKIDIEIDNEKGTAVLSQTKFINDLLIKHDMQDCNDRNLPLPTTFNIEEAFEGEPLDKKDKQKYQSLVGSYLWLNRGTRSDISEAVWLMARGMAKPTKDFLDAALHIMRFLKSTCLHVLTYSRIANSSFDLSEYQIDSEVPTCFCDSNWAAPTSQSSNIIMFLNAALLWRTHKQESTALSSVQAELTALSEEAIDMKYSRKVLHDLGIRYYGPLPIFCDSKGAIENAKHPTTKNKLKHCDLKCFFIRECVDRHIVSVHKIAGIVNPADIGTKLLGKSKFIPFANYLLNRNDK